MPDASPDLAIASKCVELAQLAYAEPEAGARDARNAGYESYRYLSSRAGRDVAIIVSEPQRHFVAIRGSDELRDWLTNLAFWRVSTPLGTLHKGYYDTALALLPEIETALQALPPAPAVFTGHSMGGALAPLCALAMQPLAGYPPAIYTFGQPTLGGRSFARYLHSRSEVPYFRFIHGADAIAVWGTSAKLLAGTPCYFDHRGRLVVNRATVSRPKLGFYFHRMAQYRYLLRLNQMKADALRSEDAVTRIDRS